jgi:hypothetical protein
MANDAYLQFMRDPDPLHADVKFRHSSGHMQTSIPLSSIACMKRHIGPIGGCRRDSDFKSTRPAWHGPKYSSIEARTGFGSHLKQTALIPMVLPEQEAQLRVQVGE